MLELTISGNVNYYAIYFGIEIYYIFKFGSGEITVLAENSTHFPLKLFQNQPFFPFILYNKPKDLLNLFLTALDSEHSEF